MTKEVFLILSALAAAAATFAIVSIQAWHMSADAGCNIPVCATACTTPTCAVIPAEPSTIACVNPSCAVECRTSFCAAVPAEAPKTRVAECPVPTCAVDSLAEGRPRLAGESAVVGGLWMWAGGSRPFSFGRSARA